MFKIEALLETMGNGKTKVEFFLFLKILLHWTNVYLCLEMF